MTYYETVVPLASYRAHEVKRIEDITERPMYCSHGGSALLKIFTASGKVFYTDQYHLDDMQKHPDCYPLEKEVGIAPAQKGSGAG